MFDAGAIHAELTLGREQFNRELDAARADAERFAAGDYQAKAGLNAGDAQRTVNEVRGALDQLSRDRADPSVHLSDEEFLAKLAELRAKLHELGDEKIDVPTDKAQEHLKELKDKADSAAGSAGGGGVGGLLTAGLALGPALIPVAGALTAGIGGLTSVLGVATVGLGSFAALAIPSFQGVGKEVQQISKDQAALNAAVGDKAKLQALQQLTQDYAKIPAVQKPVVQGVLDFKTALQDTAKQVQPQVYGAFFSFLDAGRSLLPQLVGPARATALALGDLGKGLQHDFQSQGFQIFMNFVSQNARGALDAFGRSLNNLGKGFGFLMEDFAPLVPAIESGMVRITAAFARWAQNLGGSQGFQNFLQYVHDNSKPVGDALKNIGDSLVSIVRASAGLGGVEIRALADLAGAINAIASVPGLGPVVVDIGLLALAVGKLSNIGFVASALTALSTALKGLLFSSGAEAALAGLPAEITATGVAAETASPRLFGFAAGTAAAESSAATLGPAAAGAGIGLGALGVATAGVIAGVAEYAGIGFTFNKSLQDTTTHSSAAHDALTAFAGVALLAVAPAAALAIGADKLFNVFTGGGDKVQLATTKVTAASLEAAQLSNSMQAFAAQTGVSLQQLATSSAPAIIKQHIADIATGAIQAQGSVQSLAIIMQEQMNHAVGVTQTAGQQISQSVSSNFGQVAAVVGRNMNISQADTQGGTQAMLQIWTSFGNQQLANTSTWTRQMNDDFGNAMRVAAAEFQSGGQTSVDNLSTQLGIGKADLNRILDEFDLRFGATATNAGVAGTDTGSNFGEQARAFLAAKYGPFSTQVAAYDNALQAGINPIAAAVAAGNPGVDTFGGGSAPGPLPPGALGPGSPARATGGMLVNHPMFLVGEESPRFPEVVISTNPAYHAKNVGLLAKATNMMGLQTGGFMDASQVPKPPALTPTYGTVAESFGVTGQGIENNLYNQVVATVTAAANRRAAAAVAQAAAGLSGMGSGDRAANIATAAGMIGGFGWGQDQMPPLIALWDQESGWNANAANPTSNARGIAQNIAGWGPGYEAGNAPQQISWGLSYIKGRYGSPAAAEAHEQSANWYGAGGIFTSPQIIGVGEKGPEAVVPLGHGGAFGGHVTLNAPFIVQGNVSKEAVPGIQRALDQHYGKMMAELRGHGVITPPGGTLS